MEMWSPLWSATALTGEPQDVLQLSSRLANFAAVCEGVAGEVDANDLADWVGDAATAFDTHRRRYSPHLEALASRLTGASGVLRVFAQSVDAIQSEARGLLARARGVESELVAVGPLADEQRSYLENQTMGALLGNPPAPWPGPDYVGQQGALQSEMDILRSTFGQLVNEYATTAHSAVVALNALTHDGMSDTRWSILTRGVSDVGGGLEEVGRVALHGAEYVGSREIDGVRDALHFVNDHLSDISRCLKDASDILGVASLVCMSLCLLPPPADAVAATASVALKALSLVALGTSVAVTGVDAGLAAEHKGSAKAVTFDLISVVSNFGAVKFANAARALDGLGVVSVKAELHAVMGGGFRSFLEEGTASLGSDLHTIMNGGARSILDGSVLSHEFPRFMQVGSWAISSFSGLSGGLELSPASVSNDLVGAVKWIQTTL